MGEAGACDNPDPTLNILPAQIAIRDYRANKAILNQPSPSRDVTRKQMQNTSLLIVKKHGNTCCHGHSYLKALVELDPVSL